MPRTPTAHLSSFTRPNSVTYTIPSPPYSSPYVTITLPPSSTWTSGLHWHETHTEYLQIISGTALVTLNGRTESYTSGDGVITVPRFARHEWRRADAVLGGDGAGDEEGQELVVREWTDPADGKKEVFFRNLSSVIADEVKAGNGRPREWLLTWKLWVVFWGLDNWPVLFDVESLPVVGRVVEGLGVGRWVEWMVTHVVLGAAVVVGRVPGLRSVYGEYTPRREEKEL